MDYRLALAALAVLALIFFGVGYMLLDDGRDYGVIPADDLPSGPCYESITDGDTGYTQSGFIDNYGVTHYV